MKKQQCLQSLLYFLINGNLTSGKKSIVFRAHSSQGFPGRKKQHILSFRFIM